MLHMDPRRDYGKESSSSSNNTDDKPDDENGIPLERKDTTVAQLRRLASKDNRDSSLSLGDSPILHHTNSSILHANDNIPPVDLDANRASGVPPFTSLLGAKSTGNLHADIKNFVNKEYVKSSALKELARHCVFIIVFIAALTLNRSAYESYLMNQSLISAFVTQQIEPQLQPFSTTFQDIAQASNFANWLINIVGGTLDTTENYNYQPLTPFERNYIQFNNRLLGGVRIRQLRAAPGKGCKLPHQLHELSEIPGKCLSWDYGSGNKDTEPFGPINPDTGVGKYTYSSESQCGSVSQFGYMLSYLEGGGYVVDLPLELMDNGTGFTEAIETVINDTFIDAQTRAIIVTMNFANLDLESRISVMYFILEMPGNGLFFPNYVMKTFRLNLYVTSLDYFRLFLEIVIILFVAFAWYTELHEMYQNYNKGNLKKYFYNFWNIIELIDLVLFLTVIILYAKYIGSAGRYGLKLDSRQYFPDLEQIAASALIFYNLACVNVIISTFRTFKYLRLNNRLYVLWKTLRHAGADLVGFLFIFLILVFGFIFMGWTAFGQDLMAFNTMTNSFGTCWNFILGNVPDYGAMSQSNRIIGPFFFVLFTIFVFFILANMFIAILSNSFEVVSGKEDNFKLSDILEEKIESVMKAVADAYYFVANKGKARKRSIQVLLDELVEPEILDKPKLHRADIERAIGPTATKDEVDDLYRWIKKLENKKAKKARATTGEGDILMGGDNAPEPATIGKSAGASFLGKANGNEPGSPPAQPGSPDEVRDHINALRTELQELKDLMRVLIQHRSS